MEVINYSTKLVKPAIPTPTIRRYFNISFIDELAPTFNIPLILYYSTPLNRVTKQHDNLCDHLEDSLSKTLSEYYPFAGRYIRDLGLIDCNDQGVLYVLGKVNVSLSDVLGLGNELDPGVVNSFLPYEIGAADEVDDPMLSVKVTSFECGGFAIGICCSHRISDMGTLCNLVNNWAARSNGGEDNHEKYSPVFNSSICFPQRGLPQLDLRVPRSSVGVTKVARRFVFKREMISAMRENVGWDGNTSTPRPSKVQLVAALLWKALVHMDQTNNGQSKASFLIQAVDLRRKVVPQLPTNSCGNFMTFATSQLEASKGEKMSFQGFFHILRDSVQKTISDCAKILTHDEEGFRVVIEPYFESNRNMGCKDLNFYLFTSWCKFSYFEADFGCGKPIWVSPGKIPAQNSVIMLDDNEGDGVEVWVHLDDKRMKKLEHDHDIKTYAI